MEMVDGVTHLVHEYNGMIPRDVPAARVETHVAPAVGTDGEMREPHRDQLPHHGLTAGHSVTQCRTWQIVTIDLILPIHIILIYLTHGKENKYMHYA